MDQHANEMTDHASPQFLRCRGRYSCSAGHDCTEICGWRYSDSGL